MSFSQSVGLVTVGKDLRTLLRFGFLCDEPRPLAHADAAAPSLIGARAAPGAPPDAASGSRWVVVRVPRPRPPVLLLLLLLLLQSRGSPFKFP